jgi:2-methylisocitrate lyase-like PEP mutase family enzyme
MASESVPRLSTNCCVPISPAEALVRLNKWKRKMNQADKAKLFAKLHVKGSPVILYNAWDAGSAKTIVEAGAQAIATSSRSVAAAQGYEDGEDLPMSFVEQIAGRITASVDVPVTIDFEGGYSEDEAKLGANVSCMLDLGIVGINFEDRVVKGKGVYSTEQQSRRIAAIRKAAGKKGIELFINARTDLFLGQRPDHVKSVDEALERANAYAEAGASGFFIPGLQQAALIRRIAENSAIPVNVMVMDGVSNNKRLAEMGVSRISYGPIPYADAMEALKKSAECVHQ